LKPNPFVYPIKTSMRMRGKDLERDWSPARLHKQGSGRLSSNETSQSF
jgi:hypothetical protein